MRVIIQRAKPHTARITMSMEKKTDGVTMTIQVTNGPLNRRDELAELTQSRGKGDMIRNRIGEAGRTGPPKPVLKNALCLLEDGFNVGWEIPYMRIRRLQK